jgi:hypothetical protein
MIKVEGHDGLYRDPDSGAIVTTRSSPNKTASHTIKGMRTDINTLKEELSDIKHLLREILRNASN